MLANCPVHPKGLQAACMESTILHHMGPIHCISGHAQSLFIHCHHDSILHLLALLSHDILDDEIGNNTLMLEHRPCHRRGVMLL